MIYLKIIVKIGYVSTLSYDNPKINLIVIGDRKLFHKSVANYGRYELE